MNATAEKHGTTGTTGTNGTNGSKVEEQVRPQAAGGTPAEGAAAWAVGRGFAARPGQHHGGGIHGEGGGG
jgi:hypothetical protein